jgi:hypothetical protein
MQNFNHSTFTSENTLQYFFSKYMVNEQVFMNLVSLSNISALANLETWQNNVFREFVPHWDN